MNEVQRKLLDVVIDEITILQDVLQNYVDRIYLDKKIEEFFDEEEEEEKDEYYHSPLSIVRRHVEANKEQWKKEGRYGTKEKAPIDEFVKRVKKSNKEGLEEALDVKREFEDGKNPHLRQFQRPSGDWITIDIDKCEVGNNAWDDPFEGIPQLKPRKRGR